MGAVNFSIDIQLIEVLKKSLNSEVFVETGTFEGDTVQTVKNLFPQIHSIEISDKYYQHSKKRFKNESHVFLHIGDSQDVLKTLMKTIENKSVIYFLDAHWCVADATGGEKSQCPLLDEMKAIETLNDKSVIIIDDARLFLAPPPEPHQISQWPILDDVLNSLYSMSNTHALTIFNDIILFYPKTIHSHVCKYAYYHGIDLLNLMHKMRDYDNLRKQFDGLLVQLNEKEIEIKKLAQMQKVIDGLLVQLKEKEIEIKKLPQMQKVIDSLLVQLKEKEIEIKKLAKMQKVIDSLLMQLNEKEIEIKKLAQMQKIKNIHYLKESARKFFKIFFKPRLGNLEQHLPKKLIFPKKYYKNQKLNHIPKISIVTPSFNQAPFLKQTIESVLNQKYQNLEYIIQDGASNDASVEIIKTFEEQLTHWQSVKDEGQSHAINLGFQHATGEIMAYLNSDDILLPGTLNYIAAYFNNNPHVDVVYGHRILINENSDKIGNWILPAHDADVLKWADFIPQETLFWRSRIWKKIGGRIDESFKFAMDWDLLLRFQSHGAKFRRLPRFLAAFRVHSKQKTSSMISNTGTIEMDRLRQRSLGRSVDGLEIHQNIKKYLKKHCLLHVLHKLNILSY